MQIRMGSAERWISLLMEYIKTVHYSVLIDRVPRFISLRHVASGKGIHCHPNCSLFVQRPYCTSQQG